MQENRNRNNRGRVYARSRAYVCEYLPKYSVTEVMGYLKGKCSLMIFDRHAILKYKYGNRNFWRSGYYVDTLEKNAKKIEEYVRN